MERAPRLAAAGIVRRDDHGGELGLGRDLAADLALGPELPDLAAAAEDLHMQLQPVPRRDDLAEAGLVQRHEIDEEALVDHLQRLDDEDGGGLRHRLDDEDARHHRLFGKVALEMRLVDGITLV